MEIVLYSTTDGENVINKDLDEKYRFNIKMKKDTDIITPTIILNDKSMMDFNSCNYCYIEEFNRYYFIRTVENLSNHIWALVMECDVLESFKNDILNSDAEINRRIKEGDYFSTNMKVETIREIDVYKSDVTLVNEKNIILSTIGGA